jgi:hypothetical protein
MLSERPSRNSRHRRVRNASTTLRPPARSGTRPRAELEGRLAAQPYSKRVSTSSAISRTAFSSARVCAANSRIAIDVGVAPNPGCPHSSRRPQGWSSLSTRSVKVSIEVSVEVGNVGLLSLSITLDQFPNSLSRVAFSSNTT